MVQRSVIQGRFILRIIMQTTHLFRRHKLKATPTTRRDAANVTHVDISYRASPLPAPFRNHHTSVRGMSLLPPVEVYRIQIRFKMCQLVKMPWRTHQHTCYYDASHAFNDGRMHLCHCKLRQVLMKKLKKSKCNLKHTPSIDFFIRW